MFKFKSTILILSLSTTFALANGYFIGISNGLNHSSVNDDNNDLISDNNLLLSPKFGYQINNTHRYSISYEHGGKSSDSKSYDIELDRGVIANESVKYEFTSNKFLLGYDYTPLIWRNLRADIGVFAGYSFGKLNVEDGPTQDTSQAAPGYLDGFNYGAKLGALYEIGNRWDIEFGAKIMRTTYKSKDLDISFDIDGGKTHEVENNTFRLKQLDMGAYLGVSYRF